MEFQFVVCGASEQWSECVEETWIQEENAFHFWGIFSCSNVHFEDKPSEVVGEEGGSYFGVIPVLKYKIIFFYIKHEEYIKERAICEGARPVTQ